MDVHQIEQWNIAHMLPTSERISIPTLLQVFSSTSASYKYLFFLALMKVLESTHFDRLIINLHEILLEMLVHAWYPHTYFKLSFGINDRIAQELDRLQASVMHVRIGNSRAREQLKEELARTDYTQNGLLDLVPYRLISPFFTPYLKGKLDARRNNVIVQLASREFDTIRPFYCFTEDQQSIVMHPQWMLYFYENHSLVCSFIAWNWLTYMQKRNPSVPNIQTKLFPPMVRNSLTTQTNFWKQVLTQRPLSCIFSKEIITKENFSLDHFLPWSFVAHDQLWNLLPVSRSINSAKSNNLPSLSTYLSLFADMQYTALSTYCKNPGAMSWEKIIEPYIVDLHVKREDILHRERFISGLTSTIEPLYSIASTQGFANNWIWCT